MGLRAAGWPETTAERYRQAGCWIGETFGGMLRRQAVRFGDREALVDGRSRWSYGELDERADRLAAGFSRLGVRPGDRVVVQLPNRAEFFEVCFALFRLGAVPVLALPAHRFREIAHVCERSQAVALVVVDVWSGYDYRELAETVRNRVPTLRHIVVAGEAGGYTPLSELRVTGSFLAPGDVDASDVALFQLSGGSTGLPKLIPRTHDDYLYSVRQSNTVCGIGETDVYMAVLPVAHNFPLSSPGALGALAAGGRVVLAESAAPDAAFPLIERERVTVTSLVPTLAAVWAEAAESGGRDLSSLRLLQVGGAKLKPEWAARLRGVLGGGLQQVYGMAEGLVCYTRPDDPEEVVLNTQGRPMSPLDEIRIVDETGRDVPPGEVGRLLVRGPYTIRGYYNADAENEEAFTPDGYYRTGDLVRMRPDGYLVVEGRVRDVVHRAGEKISAEEVERHLAAHPAVRDAAVVAVPDDFLGERMWAFVVPLDESGVSEAELKAFLSRLGLATYKIPDRIEWIDALPLTAVGKVDKQALRERGKPS